MFNQKEYMKQYYKDNSEKVKKANEKWRKNNLEKFKKYQKKYRENNPEKTREYSKRRHKEKSQYIREYKLLKGCLICGYNKCADALCFHHNGNKEFCIRDAGRVSLERLKKEMEKCIVLCRNCHAELHEKERGDKEISKWDG